MDVNTGKYTGSISLEHTVFEINMEAAREIPRLLRLRNLRGIIIVDFIDMGVEQHRTKVLEAISQESRKDRSKTVVVGWTKLGLLEMTRKRK
jgi:ribonuclease G